MSLIYEPKGRAREYAALACSPYSGCDHGCLYCFSPAVTRKTRDAFAQVKPRADFLKQLEKEAAARRPTDPVLLSFTTDPYCNADVEHKLTRETIKILHANGHAVNVLTKGGTRALRDLDLFGPRDAFATTLTFPEREKSLTWEPGAATPVSRVQALYEYHLGGIPTWASLEPVIDPEAALQIIRETYPFVDLYKIGRWNYDARANAIDWRKFAHDAVALLEALGKRYYIKRDLAVFLEGK